MTAGASGWVAWRDASLGQVRADGRWRSLRPFDGGAVSFGSNDYLGLATHPAVVAAATAAAARWGAGSGASRLVTGTRPVHQDLEAALAGWKGTEAAVAFSSGYAANVGVLSALGGEGVTIFSDALNHASIVDGCRLSRAGVVVYPHRDVEALEKGIRNVAGRVAVVTETVFSMDGDVAPLDSILRLCRQREALLVLDDAHGVLGAGVAAVAGVEVLRVGTLSKALGSLGGFVAASRAWVDWLVNRSRPFIFTTALSPADAGAALAAVGIVRSAEGESLVARLRAHVERVAPGHPSPIVPLVLGSEQATLAAAAALLERGLLVPAIRPPTVAPGTSRLRVSLSAAHAGEDVDRLLAALSELGLAPAPAVVGARRARPPAPPPPPPPSGRPGRVVAVLGTGTDVGKTWVAAGLLSAARGRGLRVAARKPTQSFGQPRTECGVYTPHSVRGTDAEVLAGASGEDPRAVCPPERWYPRALAPPVAAAALGRPAFSVADLAGELRWPAGTDLGVVEGAGGVRSPLAADGDAVDLLALLRPDLVVLVTPAGLGTLNQVRMSCDALARWPVVVYLNRFDPDDEVHATNRAWLAEHGTRVVADLGSLAGAVVAGCRDGVHLQM